MDLSNVINNMLGGIVRKKAKSICRIFKRIVCQRYLFIEGTPFSVSVTSFLILLFCLSVSSIFSRSSGKENQLKMQLVLQHNRWNWVYFPLLEKQDDFIYTCKLITDLEMTRKSNISMILGVSDSIRMFMEQDIGGGWIGDHISFNSRSGYKIFVWGDEPYIIELSGKKIAEDTKLILEPYRENWVGYFVNSSQTIFEAFGEYLDDIREVRGEDWGFYRDEDGNWIHSSNIPMLHYGKAYSVMTNLDTYLPFQWNLGKSNYEVVSNPEPKHFTFKDEMNYESFFVESIENDKLVKEVAIFADDECVGASVFMGKYPLEIQAFVDMQHLDTRLSFVVQREDDREEIKVVELRKEGKYEAVYAKPLQKRFSIVKLGRVNDVIPVEIVKPDAYFIEHLLDNFLIATENNQTKIEIHFNLLKAGVVELGVFNTKGGLARKLLSGEMSAGRHTLVWDGKDDDNNPLDHGVYFYRLLYENTATTKNVLLLR